jgi:hypothetical protein
MKQDKINAQLRKLTDKLMVILGKFRRYSLIVFVVFVGCIYGFLLLRTHTLNDAQPSTDAVTSQVKAARLPHIDQSVVNQLKTLRDNSVNVQALFDQGRNNPFQ